MTPTRRDALLCLSALCGSPFVQAQTRPQSWPAKPVKLVVAFAPGGPADTVARLLGQRLGERLGQPVVVENRPGAGGNIAAQQVAQAPADGYTLLVTTSAFAVNPSLKRNSGYDPAKDYVPVNLIGGTPNLLVASPNFAGSTLKDVFRLAKTEKLSYGSAGAGTTPHLSAEYLFKTLNKADIVHVAFTGAGPALNAAAGSQIPLASVALSSAIELVKAGRVKPLAVTSAKRVPSLPQVPTVAELGYPGFSFLTWVGVFAPAKTPRGALERLNSESNLILFVPEFQQQLDQAGFSPIGGALAQANDTVRAELSKYAKVIRVTGITPDGGEAKMKIGFIGLGAMGLPMARHIARAGHDVIAWNRTRAATATDNCGGNLRLAETPMECVDADIVVTMLADDHAVEEVLLHKGILAALAPATLHVEMATISIALTKRLEGLHARRQGMFVAAPVFGRVEAAEAAQLFVVAAGDSRAVQYAAPVFDAVGQKTFIVGKQPHMASLVKISGNLLVAAAIENLSEAIALVRKAGMDPREYVEVITSAVFPAPVYAVYGKRIATRSYVPASFKLPLGLKDINLALSAGTELQVPLPTASLLRDHFTAALAQGHADKDWAAIGEVVAANAGL